MATEVTHVIDPDSGSGYDYASLNAWEAAQDRDLVTADEQETAKCRCTSGSADTTRITIDGWTTDSTRYIKIWTDPNESYRHDGKWNTNAYRLDLTVSGYFYGIQIKEEYCKIDGLQIKLSGTTSYDAWGIFVNTSTNGAPEISRNIVCADLAAGGNQVGISASWSSKIFNNIIYGFEDKQIFLSAYNSSTSYVYSNTCIGGDKTVDQSHSHTVVAKNNIAKGGATTCYDGNYDSASDYNLSSDGSAPGTNSVTNATVTFVDEANDDYHLDSTDTTAKDAGTDLSSDSNLAFSDDIDGDTRSGTWDIGADEYVAAGGTTVNSNVIALFDIRNQVNSNLQALFDILNTAYSSLSAPFDIFSTISSGIQSLFDIKNTVQSNLESLYDVRNIVYSNVEGLFDLLNTVNSSLAVPFDILSHVSSDLQALWDMRNIVNSNLVALYDVAGRTGSSLEAIFDIENVESVHSDMQGLFDVLNAVSSEDEFVFDILNKAHSDIESLFDLRNKAVSNMEGVFDVRAVASSNLIALYDMAGKVSSDLTLIYAVLSLGGKGRGLSRLGGNLTLH